jgi:8-oxo-dGTP pyrophosphatase MutT (NUDIX family)
VPVPIENVRSRLTGYSAKLSAIAYEAAKVRASVAIVLREVDGDCEMLLIRRAEKEGDVWSGDIAFPGGRVDSAEESPRAAAERETMEEVGIDLARAQYLGRLDDLSGRTHAVVVSAFVYELVRPQPTVLNHEVCDVRWMSLGDICDSEYQVMRKFDYRDEKIELPGIRVFEEDAVPVLWGLTYRFLELLMKIVERPIPDMPWRSDL